MQTIKVFPNPWAAYDKDGRPCGACPRDHDRDGGGPGLYVGARVDRERCELLQKYDAHDLRKDRYVIVFEYMGIPSDDPDLGPKLAAKEPIEIPVTKYYRERLQEGALLRAEDLIARFPVAAPVPDTAPESPAPKLALKRKTEPDSEAAQ